LSINNLGDYGKITKDLKAAGGSARILYKSIGDTAIAKASPKLLLKGGGIGAGALALLGLAVYGGYKLKNYISGRKQIIENEPVLVEEFTKAVEADVLSELENDKKSDHEDEDIDDY